MTCQQWPYERRWQKYFISRRSNSLNVTYHISIFSLSSNLTGCWRKKRVTRFRLSLASTLKANPPIAESSASLTACLSLARGTDSVETSDLSAIPKRGVLTGDPAAHSVPSQGNRQCTSSLVKLLFHLSEVSKSYPSCQHPQLTQLQHYRICP